MKPKKFKVPVNTSVSIGQVDNKIVIEFVPDEVFEVGKWYDANGSVLLVLSVVDKQEKEFQCCGFIDFGKGFEWTQGCPCDLTGCNPADMKHVESLLIAEAKRRGFKEGVKYNFDDGSESVVVEPMLISESGELLSKNGCNIILSNGEWAEIIKTPLYKNQYGTEFFEGDDFWWVTKRGISINRNSTGVCPNFKEDKYCSEVMTRKQCHMWIYQNWEELKK